MRKSTAVKCPVDVLANLKKDFPEFDNPTRIRLIYNDHLEMNAIKEKVKTAGEILYGKKAWNTRYK